MGLNFKIHRGTNEIGGSCIEIYSSNTRIIIDFGMPFYERDGKEFDFKNYKNFNLNDLIEIRVLPDIDGVYNNSKNFVDGVIISHSHLDHYGFAKFIKKEVKFYLSEGTHKIIEINNIFLDHKVKLQNVKYVKNRTTFKIGNIYITPFLVDHSAFDAYSFLIQSEGKSLFYSGDFRSHGRKGKLFYNLLKLLPKNIDYLILEGSNIDRFEKCKTETQIENDFFNIFYKNDRLNLMLTSSQNIDRFVSIYKAALRTEKILIIDTYTAIILNELSKYANIPNFKNFKNIKIFEAKKLNSNLRKYEITKQELMKESKNIIMLVRPSMRNILEDLNMIKDGNFIYSLWEGYFEKESIKNFVQFLINDRNFKLFNVHTSGHADVETLKRLIKELKPKELIPMHTFSPDKVKALL